MGGEPGIAEAELHSVVIFAKPLPDFAIRIRMSKSIYFKSRDEYG